MGSIIDCHAHLPGIEGLLRLRDAAKHLGLAHINIVSQSLAGVINENPPAFAAKAAFPDFFYIFAGLDHSAQRTSGRVVPVMTLAEQAGHLRNIGADGIKMIEGKPGAYESLGVELDGGYLEPFFAYLEAGQFPLLWHVADPEEFWDPATTPDWAASRGWGYGPDTVPKEALYRQAYNVLRNHPDLRVIFPHFFFLSADLPRAARLLESYPNVHLDLAPGVEYLHNMSACPDETRDFFERYSNRIIYGSDLFSRLKLSEAVARGKLIMRWLETDDEFPLPGEADFLLGVPADGAFHGISLSPQALERIYHENFERFAGLRPRALDPSAAADECTRLALELHEIFGSEADTSEADRCRQLLCDTDA